MGATIHQTQRRIACEICRRHKSRCRRLHPNDSKCVRYLMLGTECITGQQKRVGRPRRAADAGNAAAKGSKSTYPNLPNPQSAWIEEVISQPTSVSEVASNELSWSNVLSPELTLVPGHATAQAPDDAMSTLEIDAINRLLQMPRDDAPFWDAPNDPVEICSSSAANSVLGVSTQRSYSTNTTPTGTTASSPAESVNLQQNPSMATEPTQLAADSITATEAMARLSKINLNLHVRAAAAEAITDSLDLSSLIYKESPLYMDNSTLAEFVLGASQDFLMITTRLRASRPTRGLLCGSQTTTGSTNPTSSSLPPRMGASADDYRIRRLSGSPQLSASKFYHDSQYNSILISSTHPFAASEPLLAPLALTSTSIFLQLISLCELILKHMTKRVEQNAVSSITPIPGLMFGGLPLAEPCTQGMPFSNAIVHLLERIERSLGFACCPKEAKRACCLRDRWMRSGPSWTRQRAALAVAAR